ncbi:MAG: glycoside-pentoside-hexuronide (GPH):cation symporter [Oscillospiraceae bacterium]|nr:glycoside-pentoside-hexuronide (GPH):cation symporter [Oscillospiraceae bacterium]
MEIKKEKDYNRFTFGIGTIGRDMLYTLISMYFIFYLTDVIKIPTNDLWWITAVILCARVFDAFSDPVMGLVVDNTKTRFGKFKPWILFGTIASGIVTILLFTNFNLQGGKFVVLFGFLYLLWGLTFTTNDISYWSMLPTLSLDQKKREKIGSFAKICANIGLFFVVAGIVPITGILGNNSGSLQRGYFYFAIMIVIIMWLGQSVTLLFVREPHNVVESKSHTSLREMVNIIFKNDQLLYTAISMSLFMIGYVTTTSFGIYFFKYAYGDENMYSIFAVILGVAQISALAAFPIFSKRFKRKALYTFAMIVIFLGYILFFFAPTNTMIFIGIAGMLIFIGQAFIQLLMLMFLADTVDYGHLKFKKRNDSITFSLQPFINKIGAAVANAIVGAIVIISGIKAAAASNTTVVPQSGLLIMKIAMLIFPLICIFISYMLYRTRYKIDEETHKHILDQLEDMGELK